MICIYSTHISERLKYVCEFIFTSVLNTEFKILDTISADENYNSIINYSDEQIDGFQIIPNGLLQDTEIRKLDLKVSYFNGSPVVFESKNGDLPFDLFSMVFYFVSRYEEYLNFTPDEHDRFPATESFAFKNKILEIPFVDRSISIFCDLLCEKYPKIQFKKPKVLFHATIDVDNAFHVKGKSFFRFLGVSIKDILKLNIKEFARRVSILKKDIKDPFDFYEEQIEISKTFNIPLTYFILYSKSGKFDRSLSPKNSLFENLIEQLNFSTSIGIHPSYHTSDDSNLMKFEISSFRSSNRKVLVSRQHFLRFRFPDTFNSLIENGITEDFSMGFSTHNGFRAGTAYPFKFYDLKKEKITKLLIHPLHVMDSVFYDQQKKNPTESWKEILKIVDEIKSTGGTFTFVWHDRAFDELSNPDWKDCYIKLHEYLLNDSLSAT